MGKLDCDKLPLFKFCHISDNCFDGEESTVNCWVAIYTQLVGSLLFLFAFPFIISRLPKSNGSVSAVGKSKSEPPVSHTIHEEIIYDISDDGSSDAENMDSQTEMSNKNTVQFGDVDIEEFEDNVSLEEVLDKGCVISTTFRSEANFLKSNFDTDIMFPSDYKPEYVPITSSASSRFALIKLMFTSCEITTVIMRAAGLSLFSSSISSAIRLFLRYEDFLEAGSCVKEEAFTIVRDRITNLESVKAITVTIDNYKFLPIFLVLAYTAFLVERWRDFLQTCYSTQGAIQDIGLLAGSIVHVPVTRETKKQLYKIYRYLNMAHVLCYASFIPSWVASKELTANFGERIGLLTGKEATFLLSMDNKAREGLLTLLLYELRVLLEQNDTKNDAHAIVLNQQVIKIRAVMATIHDTFTLLYPNEYMLMMMVLLQSYTILIVVGYSLILFDPSSRTCFQPMVLVGVFFSLLAMYIPSTMFAKIRNPFTENSTGIEVTQLIASTESSLFCSMRVLFHREDFSRLKSSFLLESFRQKSMRGQTMRMSCIRKGGFGEL